MHLCATFILPLSSSTLAPPSSNFLSVLNLSILTHMQTILAQDQWKITPTLHPPLLNQQQTFKLKFLSKFPTKPYK